MKRIIALTFAALWLPVSMHCSLEAVPGFNLLDLCCDTAAPQNPKNDCHQDNCAEIEAGLYRVEDNPTLTPDLSIVLAIKSPIEVLKPVRPIPPDFSAIDSSPPELAQTWQFSRRAALPVRAPSLVS